MKKKCLSKTKNCFVERNEQNVVHGKNGCFVKEALSMSVTNESKRWSRVRVNNPQKKEFGNLWGFVLEFLSNTKKIMHNFTILIYNCTIKHHFKIVYTNLSFYSFFFE